MDIAHLKQQAADQAVAQLRSGMAVGLGTGSTACYAVESIGRRLREGTLRDIVGIPTSERTAEQARGEGIPLTTFEAHPVLDVTIDGADEVSPELNLVKGLGGALLREKIVASASRRLVIIVDETKLVKKLGTKAPLPVEVVPFGWEGLPGKIKKLGAEPVLRKNKDGEIFVTDGKHYILDCRWPDGIGDAEKTGRELKQIVGVVETGLFINMASEVIVAGSGGIKVLKR